MVIEVNGAKKIINKNTVLDNINLSFESGRIYGIDGINGSGKTMLMRAVCGLVRLTQGAVFIDGKQIGKDMEFPESAGVLIENPGLIEDYTGFMNLRTLADIKRITSDGEIREMLIKLKLDPDDKRKVKKYSLGMRQKVGIAEAFIDNPDIVILDEPFNALDEKSVEIVKQLIKEYINEDRIIIISCHDSNILNELCDKIYYMEEGKIIEK